MGWFSLRQKKKAKPLVPGRDRSSTGSQRPAYSYYSVPRPAPTGDRSPVRREGRAPVTTRRRRVSGQHVVFVICSVLVVFSLGKVFAVSQESSIVLSADTDTHITDAALDTYRATADELLAQSPLNRFKLTVDTYGIAAELKAQFPELESVVISLPILGNRPVVYVAPTTPVFALETPAGNYSVDKNGYVLARLTSQEQSLIILKDTSNRTPKPGEQYLASSITTFAATVHYELTQQSAGTIAYLDLPVSAPYELVAHLADAPYYIRFNLRADAMQQSGAVVATLGYLQGNTPSQYLDVRTPERAYYR